MKDIESLIKELYSIAAALEFIGCCMDSNLIDYTDSTECGIGYLTKILSERTSQVAENCWQFSPSVEEKEI